MTNPHPLSELKILIVDDQAEMRGMTRAMLHELGVKTVTEARNGKEAFALFKERPETIDMVLCDWNMPIMSGIELLRVIRASDGAMPFLMITARSDLDSITEAKSCGVTGYIRKPFSPEQLEAKLKYMLGKKQKVA